MRIGVLAPPWAPVPPRLYGGIELVVDLLARGFLAAGHEVVLYTTGDSTCPVERRFVLDTSQGHRIGAAVPELRHVLHAYEDLADCDLIHDHTLMGPIHGASLGMPIATTVHGPLAPDMRDLYSRIARGASVICISQAQHAAAPEVPIARVIHHGIEAADFDAGPGDGGYVAFLGRMAADKGAHRAIDAARKAGLPIRLAAKMREEPERRYFEAEVEPLLGEDAVFLGEVPHEEKLELLRGASALLFPIRWNEPFGMVMLEAFACGTPVIAFPEGAAPEVVEDGVTGFLVHSVAEMAAAIGRLGQVDRAACRAAVESGPFSAARMVADHLALFESLVER